MANDNLVNLEGTITNALGGGFYKIDLSEGGQNVRAKLCGRMKQKQIRVLPGDKVQIGVSPYDMTHGIIYRRCK